MPDEHRVEQTIRLRDGGELSSGTSSASTPGFASRSRSSQSTERVLSLLDGKRPLGDVLAEAAEAPALRRRSSSAGRLPVVRRLIELGFVLPA